MRMPSRVARTPLALAALNLLNERPMHPYEMQQTIHERGLDFALKLRSGSLYHTVERLVDAGLIEPVDTRREGRRPERTVYAVTERGRDEFLAWLRELLAEPRRDYPPVAAALAFLPHVCPDDAVRLLTHRALVLEAEIAAADLTMHGLHDREGLARLHMLEVDYVLDLRQAELDWVRQLIRQIKDGSLDGIDHWKSYHPPTRGEGAGELGDRRAMVPGSAS